MTEDNALRRLAWEAHHPPVCSRGVSAAALVRLKQFVGSAANADPGDFDHPAQGGDADMRRRLRFLCALIPSDLVPDDGLPQAVHYLLGHPAHIPLELVRDVLAGHDQETSGAMLRKAGEMLRAGASNSEVSRELGLHRGNVVMPLANYLGAADAHDEWLRDQAIDVLEDGGDPEHFASVTGLSEGRAEAVLREVAVALDMEPAWA